jgi:hypothetical protein
MMFVMLLGVYIHTGQAWKICLATVGIEPTTFGIRGELPPPALLLSTTAIALSEKPSIFVYFLAGYRMMSVLNPELCRKVTLRHCVSLVALSTLLPACDVTTWWLALDSLPVNLWFTWLAWKFHKQSDNKSARELFRFSLLHLPILMFLVLFHKKSRKAEPLDIENSLQGWDILNKIWNNSGLSWALVSICRKDRDALD